MKFKLESYEAKLKRLKNWHKTFVILPVKVTASSAKTYDPNHTTYVFLQTVMRRYVPSLFDYVPEYRLCEEDQSA